MLGGFCPLLLDAVGAVAVGRGSLAKTGMATYLRLTTQNDTEWVSGANASDRLRRDPSLRLKNGYAQDGALLDPMITTQMRLWRIRAPDHL
jgi:hypothetical protein